MGADFLVGQATCPDMGMKPEVLLVLDTWRVENPPCEYSAPFAVLGEDAPVGRCRE